MSTIEEHDEALHVAKMMVKYGGSFVRYLGEALIHADANNTKRIKEAFHDYWQHYNDLTGDE